MKPFSASLVMLLLLAAAPAGAEDATTVPQENPYTKSYVAQSKVAARAESGAAKIYLGKDRVVDYQRQLEKGYDILGYSSFDGGEVPPALLEEQAAKVNADVVLVYPTVTAKTPKSVKMDMAKAKAAGKEVAKDGGKVYSYFASYWTKLPPPILGINVRGTSEAGEGNVGLVVLAVIEGSPASAALRKDDVLLRLGEVRLDKPEALGPAVRRYAGKPVEVEFERSGEVQRAQLTLGAPR